MMHSTHDRQRLQRDRAPTSWAIARRAGRRFDVPMDRPVKITFGEMRQAGVRGVLVYCADYHCSHSLELSADRWPDHIRLSDIESRFTCQACGRRGADVRPDFAPARMGTAAS